MGFVGAETLINFQKSQRFQFPFPPKNFSRLPITSPSIISEKIGFVRIPVDIYYSFSVSHSSRFNRLLKRILKGKKRSHIWESFNKLLMFLNLLKRKNNVPTVFYPIRSSNYCQMKTLTSILFIYSLAFSMTLYNHT